MKAGERIRRIQESAESLRPRSWSEAQLVLDRFGFDTYEPDPRYGDKFDAYDCFIRQIKKGSDDQLRSLHEYLLGDDAGPTPRVGPWKALQRRLAQGRKRSLLEPGATGHGR